MLSGLTALAASLVLALGTPTSRAVADVRTLFITSAVEDGQGHATLLLHRGTRQVPTGFPPALAQPGAVGSLATARWSSCRTGSS